MDSAFSLKPHSHSVFLKSPSSSLFLPLPLNSLRPLSASKHARIQCELEAKFNGALSGDSHPRFLDRQKALEAAMNDINNSFGKGSVTRLGSAGGALVETFPSGCLTLDCALGGGHPKGRIVEIFGPESSGKTTLALHAIAEVQKLGGNAVLVDAEHAFDPAYSKALGVDVENLIVCQPDHGEMGLEIADRMCRSGAVDLICVDSVSALTPRAEIEGEIGMQQMGLQARLMSQALRKMSGNASKAGCTLIFLNQIRYKIGVYYGNPEVTSGGIALKFFASLRLEVRSIGKIKSAKGDEEIGLKVRVRVQKSKVSRPYKIAEFEIIFGEGVSKLGCILDCAEMMDVVLKKGSWYSYGDHRLGQGRDKAIQYLKENTHLLEEIEKWTGPLDAEEACRILKIALLCTQDNPKLRPSMSSVVKMLTGEIDIGESKITKPGLISDIMDLKEQKSNNGNKTSYSASSLSNSKGNTMPFAASSAANTTFTVQYDQST